MEVGLINYVRANKHISAYNSDEAFKAEAIRQGTLFTLEEFENRFNNDNFNFELDYKRNYIRFLNN